MELGWSIGDISSVITIAQKIALITKKASGTWDAMSRELEALHTVYDQLHGEMIKPDAGLHGDEEARRTEIVGLSRHFHQAMSNLRQVLETYTGTVPARKGNGVKARLKYRYMDGDPAELKKIRYDIAACKESMTSILARTTLEVPVIVENGIRLEDRGKDTSRVNGGNNSIYNRKPRLEVVKDVPTPTTCSGWFTPSTYQYDEPILTYFRRSAHGNKGTHSTIIFR